MKFIRLWSVCLAILMLPAVLSAQQFTGRVTDSTGAAVPKAKVTVLNQATNVASSTTTTGDGDYTVPYLKPGLYKVSVAAPGFDLETKTDITLQVSQTVSLDFALKIGSVDLTVSVSGEQLDRSKADVGEVVENERVNELPLNGGDLGQLAQLSAGTYYGGNVLYTRPFDNSVADLSINGAQAAENLLLLDGVSNEAAHGDAYNGTNSQIGYIAPIQSTQEFKVVTVPLDAAYGRLQGGALDITLKSGTNQLHGSVYEFARRGWLDANLWSNDFAGLPKAAHTRDQYGAQLDGPLVIPHLYNGRDKTFFVAQFENWKEVFPGTALDSVPDPAWLNGDFSNLTYFDKPSSSQKPLIIYDPLTLHSDGTRDPFPGNIIPQSRISPFAKAILSLYPTPNAKPNAQQNSYVNNYAADTSVRDTYRNALIKVDQVIGSNDRVSIRYGWWERSETQNQTGIPGVGANGEFPHAERVNTFSPDWVHTITPNLVADFKASVIVRGNELNSGPLGYDLSQLGLSSSFISSLGIFGHSLPQTNFNNNEFTSIGNTGGEFTVGDSLALLPSVTYVRGKHTIRAGFDWRILQWSWRNIRGGTTLNNDRTWTQRDYQNGDVASGNSVASFLLGTAVSSGSGVQINPLAFYSQHYYAPFIQDDWKVLPKLTLNLGFRYDLNGSVVERHNRVDYEFNQNVTNPITSQVSSPYLNGPVMGGLEFVGVNGNPRAFNALVKTNLQPRLGFSYSPVDKTVVHGGFGVFFLNPNPGPNQLGFSSTTQYNASNDNNKTPTQNLGVGGAAPNPFPSVTQPTGSSLGYLTGLGQSPFYLNPFFRTPKTYQYVVGIQQQFNKGSVVELNYVGTRTRKLGTSDNINRISTAAYAQCNPELGGNPDVCDNDANSLVTNPFQGVAAFQGSNYYTNPVIQAINFTRSFPAFGDITEYDINGGKAWYNSLQLTATQRVSQSFTLHGTWTWSKFMDAGGFTDTTYRVLSRHIDSADFAHRITFSGYWLLPVGRGRQFLGHVNRLVDAAIGGWEMSTIVSWQTGMPWQLNGKTDLFGNVQIDRKVTPTTITGVNTSCVAQWERQGNGSYALEAIGSGGSSCGGSYNLISIPTTYGIQPNVNYTGVRNPGSNDVDASLSKNFDIYERLRAQFRVDAFNLPNHPVFSANYDNSPSDGTFGQIVKASGQSNQPRDVQLTFKVTW
ncbi:carboxypeptidase regulatory-like domain-containing protein [Granulicella sp. S190]|uniref:carboxypeptidase regulatory-like domain-containing protein n=1 Tax=Granulicella sp. S190 TaxID=1747226 RepID=UPI00131E6CB7|nr:carboxypeptidase regulatory-like domain-containing protein [Granulicella sp. S190]